MSLLLLLLVILASVMVYKTTRSWIWTAGVFLAGVIILPLVWDQISMLWKDSTEVTTTVAQNSTSGAYMRTTSACNCH